MIWYDAKMPENMRKPIDSTGWQFGGSLLLSGLALVLLHLTVSCASYEQKRAYDQAAEARLTPTFSECVNGKKLSALSNCAEACQSLGKGCQNNGCEHQEDKSSRYGGLTFTGSLCLEKPDKAIQCYDPFNNEVGVRCCCVKQ